MAVSATNTASGQTFAAFHTLVTKVPATFEECFCGNTTDACGRHSEALELRVEGGRINRT